MSIQLQDHKRKDHPGNDEEFSKRPKTGEGAEQVAWQVNSFTMYAGIVNDPKLLQSNAVIVHCDRETIPPPVGYYRFGEHIVRIGKHMCHQGPPRITCHRRQVQNVLGHNPMMNLGEPNNLVNFTPFDSQNERFETLTRAGFVIDELIDEVHSAHFPVMKRDLIDAIKDTCTTEFLTAGRNLGVVVNGTLIDVRVAEIESGGDSFSPSPRIGVINEQTTIDLFNGSVQDVIVLDDFIEKEKIVSIKVSLHLKTFAHDSFSKSFWDINILEKHLSHPPMERFYLDQSYTPSAKFPLSFKFESVTVMEDDGLKFHAPSDWYKYGYVFDSSKLTFVSLDPSLSLYDSHIEPKAADAIAFSIVSTTANIDPQSNANYIFLDEFQDAIRGKERWHFGEHYTVVCSGRRITVTPFSLLEREFRQESSLKVISGGWKNGEKTKVSLRPSHGLRILKTATPVEITGVKLRPQATFATFSKGISIEELKQYLLANHKQGLKVSQKIEYTKKGSKITFYVDEIKTANSNDKIGKILLEFTPETTVVMEEIKKEKKKLLTKESVIQKLKTLNLGGFKEEVWKKIQEIALAHTLLKKHFVKANLEIPRGILMEGDPGVGKTELAKGLAKVIGIDEKRVKVGVATQILGKYVGENEAGIDQFFEKAEEEWALYGEQSKTHLLIMDEFEGVFRKREKGSQNHDLQTVNHMLNKLQGIDSARNFIFVAITNHKDEIDDAMLRSGRLGTHLKIERPDNEGRREIIEIYLKSVKERLPFYSEEFVRELAVATDNFTGADIQDLISEAFRGTLGPLVEALPNDVDEETDFLQFKEAMPTREVFFELAEKRKGVDNKPTHSMYL